MSKPNEERDIYYIPPNFLASGRLFGGMIRARNAIEACVLVLLTGIPIIKLPMSLTVRIIILCLLPLPLGIFGIIGFEGDSLSEFAINWVRWFIHRRSLYRSDVTIPETARKQKKRINKYGDRITTRGISGQLKKMAVRYGIDPVVIYPHSFRHRFAKSFLERCNDIAFLADLMGHESIETTRIYLRKTSTEQRAIVDEVIDW